MVPENFEHHILQKIEQPTREYEHHLKNTTQYTLNAMEEAQQNLMGKIENGTFLSMGWLRNVVRKLLHKFRT